MKVLKPNEVPDAAVKQVSVAGAVRDAMQRIDAAYEEIARALDGAPLQAASSSTFGMDQRYREFCFWAQMVQGAYLQEAKVATQIATAAPKGGS